MWSRYGGSDPYAFELDIRKLMSAFAQDKLGLRQGVGPTFYKTNIQIAELNALNASLAVVKFKQLSGFYFEEIPYCHILLEIADLKVVGATSDEN